MRTVSGIRRLFDWARTQFRGQLALLLTSEAVSSHKGVFLEPLPSFSCSFGTPDRAYKCSRSCHSRLFSPSCCSRAWILRTRRSCCSCLQRSIFQATWSIGWPYSQTRTASHSYAYLLSSWERGVIRGRHSYPQDTSWSCWIMLRWSTYSWWMVLYGSARDSWIHLISWE